MYKLLLFLLLTSIYAFADAKVEVFSANMDTNGSYVKASEDVLILYDGMYISAGSASFDRDSGIIEMYENVSVLKGAEYYAMGDYLMLNTKDDTRTFYPFFFQENKEELWVSSRSARVDKKEYTLKSGLVSSCNPQDPDWTIRFSTGLYDSEDQWMQMYNARLYAGELPVFYFPYFAYPTDNTRRTGLLIPVMSLSSAEGFMYQQPIYIAESPYWDLELLPQLRTKRGKGLYTKLRFIDSPNSTGSLTLGGFKEKAEYLEKFNSPNDKHYGVEFDYEHRDFLHNWFGWDVEGDSGVFADITYLNDVEYLNIKENDTLDYATTSQVTSRINIFLNQDENYYAIYGKYFIDLDPKAIDPEDINNTINIDSNKNTIQNLPIIHYHRYINTLFEDHFLYSFDYRGSNFYRDGDKNAFQNEVTVPLTLQFPLMDEYLTLSMTEYIYGSHVSFYGKQDAPAEEGYNPGTYLKDYQTIELNTNLVKAFDSFTHSVGLTLAYLHPGNEEKNGFYKDYEDKAECIQGPCEYDNVDSFLEQVSLEFTQFIFTDEEGEKLYHRIKQPLIYESGYEKYGDLENELRYYFTPELSYYNNTFYNYDRNVISKTQNTIGYNDNTFTFSLSHLYEDKIESEKREITRYITSNARYNYSQRWQYYAGYAYDIEESLTKNRHIGFRFNKRCWGIDLKYVENIRPTLGQDGGAANINDKVLYIVLNLRPIGGFEFDYKKSGN
ncbi:MAG TPA: LPS-assembly protein LptD [Sulfurimonas sp.]|nr:LPS-assembly protein LptD [Sulfurimonas sp.]